MQNIPALIAFAKSELNNLNSGEKFFVKDLFKGYEWNRIPAPNRNQFGRMFLYEYEQGNLPINKLGKNASNQQQYERR